MKANPRHAAILRADKLVQAALVHHRAGRLDEASKKYKAALLLLPKHAHALHYLGVLTHQRGDHGKAVELIGRALEAAPDDAQMLLQSRGSPARRGPAGRGGSVLSPRPRATPATIPKRISIWEPHCSSSGVSPKPKSCCADGACAAARFFERDGRARRCTEGATALQRRRGGLPGSAGRDPGSWRASCPISV